MKFKNRSEHNITIPTPAGQAEMPIYEEVIDVNGNTILLQTGTTNLYEQIQEHYESTKIETILARAAGNPDILHKYNGIYLDATELPESIGEVQSLITRVKSEFDKLPNDVKATFNGSAEQYVAEFGTKKWLDKMGIKVAPTAAPAEAPAAAPKVKEETTNA